MTRSFRILLRSTAFLAISIPVITALLVAFGPVPTLTTSDQLSPGVLGLNEPRDRFIVVGWWLLAAMAGFAVWRGSQSDDNGTSVVRDRNAVSTALVASVTAVFAASLLLRIDRFQTDNFPQLSVQELVVALLIIGLSTTRRADAASIWPTVQPFLGALLFVIYAPAFWQTPTTIRDGGHFVFTANEILAPAAGRFPLVNFVSQYTNLLGYPIAPFSRMFPNYSLTIATAWFLLLQLICLLLPVLMIILLKKYSLLLPAFFIPVALVAMSSDGGEPGEQILGSNTYFANFPLRTLVPVLIVAAIAWGYSRKKFAGFFGIAVIGALAGLAVINNPDFGGAAALATVVTFFVARSGFVARIKSLMALFLGGLVAVASFELLHRLLGLKVNWGYLILFQRIFGASGYMNEPIGLGGLPIIMATLFGLGVVLAVYILHRYKTTKDSHFQVIGVFQLFTSSWGLLSMVYFAGRSFTSTAVSGHMFQLGLVIVGALLFLSIDKAHFSGQVHSAGRLGAIFPLIGIVVVVLITMAALRVPKPPLVMDNFWRSGVVFPDERQLLDEIGSLRSSGVLTDQSKEAFQALPLANAVQLQTGVRSLLMVNHPGYLTISPELQRRHCDQIENEPFASLIESAKQESLLATQSCQQAASSDLQEIRYESEFVRLTELGTP